MNPKSNTRKRHEQLVKDREARLKTSSKVPRLAYLGLFLSLLFAILSRTYRPVEKWSVGNLVEIERLDSLPPMEEIDKFAERPFVVKTSSTPAREWQALKSWSALSMSTWNIIWEGAHTSSSPRISYYNARRRLFNYLRAHDWPLPYTDEDVPSPELFSRCRRNKTFHYVAGGLAGPLLEDVKPFTDLIVPTLSELQDHEGNVGPAYTPSPGFFFSCKGVIVPAHYDEGSNFFTQIDGNKTVVLFPPSLAPNLYTYPTSHPQYRQSQIPDIHNVNSADFVEFERAIGKGMVTTLEPGDTLYIPPWYLHYIVADDDSVSVSIMTDASTRDGFAAGYSVVREWRNLEPFWNSAILEEPIKNSLSIKAEALEMLVCPVLASDNAEPVSGNHLQQYLETRWKWVSEYATQKQELINVFSCCASPKENSLKHGRTLVNPEQLRNLEIFESYILKRHEEMDVVLTNENVHARIRSIFIHRYVDEMLEEFFKHSDVDMLTVINSWKTACLSTTTTTTEGKEL